MYSTSPQLQIVKDTLAQVQAGGTCFLTINGESGSGRTEFLDYVRRYLITDHELILYLDLADYEPVTPLLLISALAPLVDEYLCASGFVQYCKKELHFRLRPYHNILKRGLPDFYEKVATAKMKDDQVSISEEATFHMLLELLREVLGGKIPICLMIDHFERAPSSFIHLISELNATHLGVFACIKTDTSAEKTNHFLSAYRFHQYQLMHLNLGPLSLQEITDLISQRTQVRFNLHLLAALISEQSQGKAAIVLKLVQQIEEMMAIFVDSNPEQQEPDMAQWQFYLNHISQQPDRLGSLSRGEKLILALASFFGSGFSIIELQYLVDKDIVLIDQVVTLAVQKDILKIVGESYYRFQYEEDKEILRELLDFQKKQTAKNKLFQIALTQPLETHINIVRFVLSHLTDFIQLRPVDAVISALKSCADYYYQQRDTHYLTICINAILSLPLDAWWQADSVQALELFNELADESLLAKDFVLTRKICKKIYFYVPNALDHCAAVESEIRALFSAKAYQKAGWVGSNYLTRIGYHISTNTSSLKVIWLWLQVLYFTHRNVRQGYPMRSNTQKNSLAVARVIKALSGAAYMNATNKMFLPALILLGIRWSFAKGVGPGTMYAVYGYELLKYIIKEQYPILMKIRPLKNLIDKSSNSIPMARYGEIEKACFDDEFYESRTRFTYSAFVLPFSKSLRESIVGLLNSYEVGLLAGDWEFASYSSSTAAWYLLCEGNSLSSVLETINARYESVKLFGHEAIVFNHCTLKKFVLWGMEGIVSEIEEDQLVISRNSAFLLYFVQAWRFILMQDFSKGMQACERTLNFLDGGLGLPLCPYLYLFYIYCAAVLNVEEKISFQQRLKIKLYLRRLTIWAGYNKSEFGGHELLAKALQAWMHHQVEKSQEYISIALNQALNERNHYLRALACEIYLKMSAHQNIEKTRWASEAAQGYYLRWGFKKEILETQSLSSNIC